MSRTETRITPYRDGPYLVRGPFTLVDQDGGEIEIRRDVVALCRCGRSQTRPFCDGTHKTVGFRADSAATARGLDGPGDLSIPAGPDQPEAVRPAR